MSEDKLQDQRKLMKVIQAKAAELNLDLERFAIVPGFEETPIDYIEIALSLKPETVMTQEEREAAEFAEQMNNMMLLGTDDGKVAGVDEVIASLEEERRKWDV